MSTLPPTGELRAARGEARRQALETYLCQNLRSHLDVPPAHRIDRTRPLYSQGVDSITALALQRKLETALQIPVRTGHLLRENSVTELAALLSDLMDHPTPLTPTAA
ncbi:acyl carrier protein [Streptomyces bambusae]|uniref:acyl carrier protein n=1 Tax=Streptomyces bambusae TaxID=1550616 RepID=UPI001CFF6F7E|nr:acyl carrier protein [Streptomyces bambusae]MCB5170205.1 acyl carrier protein [Streptomyces bambusae]